LKFTRYSHSVGWVKAEVGKLIIGHFSARYKDHSVILKEAQAIYQNTEAITEGDVIQVEKSH